MNDVDKVRLLLLSRNDYISSPRISRVYEGAEPGPQASSYVPCENCSKTGRVKNRQACPVCSEACAAGRPIRRPRHGCSMCSSCDGRGERRRTKSDVQFDAYSNMPLEDAVRAREDDKLKHAPRRWERPGGDERLDTTEDPTWRRKAAYEAQGSYAELARQLEWLSLGHWPRYAMLMHWLDAKAQDDGLWWTWSEQAEAGVHDTIVLLARRMGKPIRVPRMVEMAGRRAA